MKKNIVKILSVILCSVCFVTYKFYDATNVEDTKTNTIKSNNNMLSMMLETSAGSGKYEVSSLNTWPTDGYVFNSELSKCENGSAITWDDTNKQVIYNSKVTDKCYIYFDLIPIISLTEYVISQYTGTQGENGLYYHDATLTNGAGDNSYRYAGGDYILTSKATSAGLKTLITGTASETTGVINYYCSGTKSYVGNTCSSANGTSGIYYTLQYDPSNKQYSTYSAALEQAITDGYLTKDNVKNFVCLDKDGNCSTENLYRIIGVFADKVKLIKYDYANNTMLGKDGDYYGVYSQYYLSGIRGDTTSAKHHYYWNYKNDTSISGGSNIWSTSLFNKTNLNTNFINYLGTWADKIETTSWNSGTTTYSSKIALMYVNDYNFATLQDNWSVSSSSGKSKSENWIYMGGMEWTLDIAESTTMNIEFIEPQGVIFVSTASGQGSARPVFFLKDNVIYESGTGTISDPIRIK